MIRVSLVIALKVVIKRLFGRIKWVGPPKFRDGGGWCVEGKSHLRGDLNEPRPSAAKNNLYWFWRSL